jgi:hypothetical protein
MLLDSTLRRYMRNKLPLQVLRGYNPTEPVKLSDMLPSIDDEEIYSGMLLKRTTGTVAGVASQLGFAKCDAADAATQQSLFVAHHDGDDRSVMESGKLVGFNCSDNFEFKTGYFDADGTPFELDDPLTAGADGVFVLATAGDQIVARISAVGPNIDGSFPYDGYTPSATDSDMIQIITVQSGAVVPTP